MINQLIQWHTDVFYFLYGLLNTSEDLRIVVHIFAHDIDMAILGIGLLILLIFRHQRGDNMPHVVSRDMVTEILIVSAAVLVSVFFVYVLKISFSLPRPFLRWADVFPLFPYGGYDSFPSGHAAAFSALATSIFIIHRKIGYVFICVGFGITVSRIIAGIHYPIDVVVGWLIGIFFALGVYRYIVSKNKR